MSAQMLSDQNADLVLRASIQKVATGPEYSKDLSFDEARTAMRLILEDRADPVQAAVFLIALRMKRETEAENAGVLQAILDTMYTVTADVDEVLDVADPYDGYTRGLAVSPFLPPIFAACGMPSISHGLESVGPKFGVTHHRVLRAAGVNVELAPQAAAARLCNPEIGWCYIDQKVFAPALHALIPLRTRIVKRPLLTTLEVLTRPVRGRLKTHLMTGYVHKAYPPVYARLARQSGFDSAVIIRGVEGGVIPSLKQPTTIFSYHGGAAEQASELDPRSIGIERTTRAVPLSANVPAATDPGDGVAVTADIEAAARTAAVAGLDALQGTAGPARDSLVYAGAIMLYQLGRAASLQDAAATVSTAIDSGAALARFQAAVD